jgi:hypothetical protein
VVEVTHPVLPHRLVPYPRQIQLVVRTAWTLDLVVRVARRVGFAGNWSGRPLKMRMTGTMFHDGTEDGTGDGTRWPPLRHTDPPKQPKAA